MCLEGGQGWEWCQLGGGYLDPKGLLSAPGTQVPSAPTPMHASQVPSEGGYVGGWEGWGKGQIEIIGFVFHFVFSVF